MGIPVIVVTGVTNEKELVACLERGADEILLKPFRPEELESAVRLLLGLAQPVETDDGPFPASEDEIDLARGRIVRRGEAMFLSRTELRILRALLSKNGQPLLHQEILGQIWGRNFRQHLAFLRPGCRASG